MWLDYFYVWWYDAGSTPTTRSIPYCTVLSCTVLYCTVLYCTVLYCTVLYCTVLYYTVLYCTILYYTPMIIIVHISRRSFTSLDWNPRVNFYSHQRIHRWTCYKRRSPCYGCTGDWLSTHCQSHYYIFNLPLLNVSLNTVNDDNFYFYRLWICRFYGFEFDA